MRRPCCSDLEHPDRGRQIPQPPRPQIHQINSAEQTRRRLGQQDLTAVSGRHHPCGPIQNRSEIVALSQFGFAGRQPHPHRQLQRPLRGHRRIHRGPGRGERGAHAVAGVFEQPAAVRLDRLAQHLVVGGQRHPHPLRVGLPPTGRTLRIGEQKRHHPRRSSRTKSGHTCRISQQTRGNTMSGGFSYRQPCQLCQASEVAQLAHRDGSANAVSLPGGYP